ncbi:SUF system NifU family Fe-S cluster assembly protein [bacterium]|nr:MAG: SUF system NifU family Fe-S cluster assembly protein [bacterium]
MMSDLRELYQEVILDHGKRPRNFRHPADANREAKGDNPLCGDQITVYLKMDGDKIDDVSFVGSGCAISKASSSMMTGAVKGKSKAEAEAIFEKFHQMVTGKPHSPPPEDIGKLAVFSGVCEFPSRVKCASLAWHTLRAAMEGKDETVSTEAEEAGDEQHNPHR